MKNFRIEEFDFHAENGFLPIIAKGLMNDKFLAMLDLARDYAKIPFIITSGLRPAAFDAQIHGIDNSDHSQGCAADIYCIDGEKRMKIVKAILEVGMNRIGIGDSHIHASFGAAGLPVNVIFIDK